MPALTEEAWRSLFEARVDHTIGVEEELMLLDSETLDLLPEAERAVEAVSDVARVRTELPASQVEIVTPVAATIAEASEHVLAIRRELAAAVAPWARVAGAGTHPFAATRGPLSRLPRYERLAEEFRWILDQQLVFGLHVHVGVRDADRALSVCNALRSHLPELAALAGNGPLHAGQDTGLSSLRPKLAEMLPRQGIPPAFARLSDLVEYMSWGEAGGLFPDQDVWWEVRMHARFGTIEVRVTDTQTAPEETAGVVAVVVGLVAWLCERHDAGEVLRVHDIARIDENRWRALRHGLGAELLDLDTGQPRPARERVLELIEAVAPAATRLGGAAELEHARALARCNGAERQRAQAAEIGVHGVVERMVERFAP